MRKFWTYYIGLLIVYSLGVAWYVWKGNFFGVDAKFTGTLIDPHTFMTGDQIERAEIMSRIGTWYFFVHPFLMIGVLIGLLRFSTGLRTIVEKWFRSPFLQFPAYALFFSLILTLIFVPVSYVFHLLSRTYGVSKESTTVWITDLIKNFWLEWVGTALIFGIIYILLRKVQKRAWLWMWIITIPLTLFLTFLQPVVIDPLFNKFEPLANGQLKQDILHLANEAQIPAHDVYQVNMSERTGGINAYVNGIGSNARIVLWDTTLDKLRTDEILTIMAHEMGHYVERHIYWGLAFGLLSSLAVIGLGFWLLTWSIGKWGHHFGIRGRGDFAAYPVLVAIVTLISFASSPIQNGFSRVIEHRADAYAMQMTHDGDAAIRAFQKIAKESLAPVTEPTLVQWFTGSHPTIEDRMVYFNQYKKQ
ncbi:M48 family metallopeptidase [Paenibacillus sp. N1-5-1-14]|uniref:M48 family metallopeptidase n=1 Tax=Paenibacillus radicibacter TaxID=2972488 RepID=UPI002158BA65|nr:M48 family metallopeptidase [Paenibacillus radicibacter]MCR8643198.1 M48 family metallopeptidase [Paenibacillus radicibacter]